MGDKIERYTAASERIILEDDTYRGSVSQIMGYSALPAETNPAATATVIPLIKGLLTAANAGATEATLAAGITAILTELATVANEATLSAGITALLAAISPKATESTLASLLAILTDVWDDPGNQLRTLAKQSGTWTVEQGTPPWAMDLTRITGAAPSVTNFLPIRVTNGTAYNAAAAPMFTSVGFGYSTGNAIGEDSATPTATTVLGRLSGLQSATGTAADALVTDPASSATVIALLKGILSRTGVVPSGASTGVASGTVSLGGSTAGTLQAIRATTYTEQSSNATRSLSSSSASDAAAGTGARTVTITYLDATGAGPFTETVTLNGTTAVNTANANICLIERIIVATVGSAGANVGTITLFAGTGGGGGSVGSIGVGNLVSGVGDNRTLWCHHYVPTGKNSQIPTVSVASLAGTSAANATFFLRSIPIPRGANAEVVVGDVIASIGATVRPSTIQLTVPGPALVVAYGVPGSNNEKLNASFDFVEVAQ